MTEKCRIENLLSDEFVREYRRVEIIDSLKDMSWLPFMFVPREGKSNFFTRCKVAYKEMLSPRESLEKILYNTFCSICRGGINSGVTDVLKSLQPYYFFDGTPKYKKCYEIFVKDLFNYAKKENEHHWGKLKIIEGRVVIISNLDFFKDGAEFDWDDDGPGV